MRAVPGQSRAVARRPLAVAVLVAALTLLSAPAASAAVHFKGQPPAGRGHKAPAPNSKATNSPVHQPSPQPTKRTAAKTKPHPPAHPAAGHYYYAPKPAASAKSKPKPKADPSAAPSSSAVGSSWKRHDAGQLDRGVVRAFTSDLKQAGQSAGFPALLVGVMIAFLLVQHRLDKRDVKLSHADWVSDQGLEFNAPTTTQR